MYASSLVEEDGHTVRAFVSSVGDRQEASSTNAHDPANKGPGVTREHQQINISNDKPCETQRSMYRGRKTIVPISPLFADGS